MKNRNNEKKLNKKKVCISVFLVIIVLILLVRNTKFKNIEKDEFNLSQYTKHGEISCNRVWVEETNDKGEKIYAYLDIDGNVIYGWNKVTDDMQCKDYYNNNAIIIEKGNDSTDIFTIIDIDGNKILGDNVLHVMYSLSNDNKEKKYWYQDFNEEGYAYIAGYIEGENTLYSNKPDMFFVNSNGLHKFNINATFEDDTYNVLIKNTKKIENYFFMCCDDTSLLIDENGKQMLDFWQACEKNPFDIEIISDNEIKLYYWEGVLVYAKFWCTVDFEGNIIHEPELLEP